METTTILLCLFAALLYILGGYAFNLMLHAVDVDTDGVPFNPTLVRLMTVLWVFVMLCVLFRDRKTA